MKYNIIPALITAALPMVPAMSYADGGPEGSKDYNPAINLIVEGRYARYDEGHFEVPGFQLVSDEGIYAKGFSTGHNELNIVAKMTEETFGIFSAAIEAHDGSTEVSIEEAYLESSSLGYDLNIKAGLFFSDIGIYNSVHEHRQAFADVPLVYAAMFNTHLVDTGLQLSWKYKSTLDLELGVEATTGTGFPGGDATSGDNNKGRAAFIKIGNKHDHNMSWKAGLSFYSSDFNHRAGSHHEDTAEPVLEIHDGSTDVAGFDIAFNFSPNGHDAAGQINIQLEYFQRDEKGEAEYVDSTDLAEGEYDGDQTGLYLQAVYGIASQWRVGFRYDLLEANNTLTNFDGDVDLAGLVLTDEDTGLIAEKDPKRSTIMLDYSPNPLTTIRLQFMNDESGHESENRIYLQYLASIGGKKH